MKIGDKVFIIQEGSLFGKKIKGASSILTGKVDYITSAEVVVELLTAEDEKVLIPFHESVIYSTPQSILEAVQDLSLGNRLEKVSKNSNITIIEDEYPPVD